MRCPTSLGAVKTKIEKPAPGGISACLGATVHFALINPSLRRYLTAQTLVGRDVGRGGHLRQGEHLTAIHGIYHTSSTSLLEFVKTFDQICKGYFRFFGASCLLLPLLALILWAAVLYCTGLHCTVVEDIDFMCTFACCAPWFLV